MAILRSHIVRSITVLTLFLLFLTSSASGQSRKVEVLPPEPINIRSSGAIPIRSAMEAEVGNTGYLERLSALYGFQSDIMAAESRSDQDAIVFILDLAIQELGSLLLIDDVVEDTRFLHVYKSLVEEHERVYGPSDTLFAAFGDIYELRKATFAAMDVVEDPLLEDVVPSGLQPVGTEVPMTMNRLVESSMQFLLRDRRESMQVWLGRADTYFPMVEKIFAEEGIPDELKYLAMIESGLNPRARSWARATGMWQFMAATGKAYDLNVNAWVDDRMDPELATRAAARHMKDLYRQYDEDWHMVLAGYNCSYRCIKRAMKKTGKAKPTYWDIYPYIPKETRNYVPLFIATALITSNPEAYGLERPPEGPQYAYHVIPVTGMLSLSDIAGMASTDVATIKALNPNLRQESLPPTMGSFYLRIPLGSHDGFIAAYDALPESAKRPSGEYIVKRGDTLSGIGSQFGVSVSRLMQKNGLTRTNIRIGQRLVVPYADYQSNLTETQFAGASESTVQYGRRATSPILVQQAIAENRTPSTSETTPIQKASIRTTSADTEATKTETPAPPKETRITYKVKRGDTLSEIADGHNVSMAKVRGWNGLSGSKIKVGQAINIYTDGRSAPAAPSGPATYRVRRGDTLSGIAQKHDVTVSQLRQWNNIRGSNIKVDQRLSIYSSQAKIISHTIRRGDTLIEISQQYGVSIANIKSWNNLTSNTIRIGQQLKIHR